MVCFILELKINDVYFFFSFFIIQTDSHDEWQNGRLCATDGVWRMGYWGRFLSLFLD